MLVGSGPDDSDVEIGNKKKKLLGDDSERHVLQLQIEGDDEKPIRTVSSKYGLSQENDIAQSQAETDRNDRPEDKTINPEQSIIVQDADTQTPGNLIREED